MSNGGFQPAKEFGLFNDLVNVVPNTKRKRPPMNSRVTSDHLDLADGGADGIRGKRNGSATRRD